MKEVAPKNFLKWERESTCHYSTLFLLFIVGIRHQSRRQFGADVIAIRTKHAKPQKNFKNVFDVLCVLFSVKNWRWELRGYYSLSVRTCKAVYFIIAQRLQAQGNSLSGLVQKKLKLKKLAGLGVHLYISVFTYICGRHTSGYFWGEKGFVLCVEK